MKLPLALAFALTALPAQADQLKVATTFTIIADMARNVAGDHAEVVSITKPGAEIHGYEPTPQDIARAAGADLILWNGLNLERWFAQFLANLPQTRAAVVSDGLAPALIASGRFREDLYYRLNVLALRVPPLRERASDIPAVVEHLLDDIANRSGQPPMELSPEALALLCAQPWRGNVRELGNLLERAQLSADGPQLQAAHLLPLLGEQARSADAPAYASSAPSAVLPSETAPSEELPLQPLAQTLAQAERRALQSALAACKGNRRRAAMELGISRASLYSKLQQHGLSQR